MTNPKNEKTHLIAVYGTLFDEKAPKDMIPGRIYDLGAFPGYKPDLDSDDMVFCSIIEVNDENLSQIDVYEGVSAGLYSRQMLETALGRDVWVYTYNGEVDPDRLIESGCWIGRAATW